MYAIRSYYVHAAQHTEVRMKILLVEDDKILNHHLKSLLEEADNQVYSAYQAEEALHFAADYPIDVAIIDLGLPDMDGLAMIRKLREQQIAFRNNFV